METVCNQEVTFPDKPVRSRKMKALIKHMLKVDPEKRIGWKELESNEIFNFDLNALAQNEILVFQHT